MEVCNKRRLNRPHSKQCQQSGTFFRNMSNHHLRFFSSMWIMIFDLYNISYFVFHKSISCISHFFHFVFLVFRILYFLYLLSSISCIEHLVFSISCTLHLVFLVFFILYFLSGQHVPFPQSAPVTTTSVWWHLLCILQWKIP